MKTFTPVFAGAIVLTVAFTGIASAGLTYSPDTAGRYEQVAASGEAATLARPTTRGLELTERPLTAPAPAPLTQVAARAEYRGPSSQQPYTTQSLPAQSQPQSGRVRPRYIHPDDWAARQVRQARSARSKISRPAIRLVRLRW